MLPYLILLLIPLGVAVFYSPSKRSTRLGMWAFFVPLLVFCGLRNYVGPDWRGYQNIYENYKYVSIDDVVLNPEPGFFLLNKASEFLGMDLYGVMFFCALIFLWGVFSFALRTENPWLAVAVVMPYLVFVISMSGIRQAAAIGFGFYMLSRWNNSSILEKLLWILLAISFHNSAVIFLFFVIYSFKGRRNLKLIGTVLVGALLVIGLNETDSYEKYRSTYIERNIVSGGAFFHVLLSSFPAALYFWHRRKIRKVLGSSLLIDMAALMALAALPLVAISSTGIDRLALYLSFIQMWVYGAVIRVAGVNKKLWKILIGMFVLLIFFVYFIFGTHAIAYIPYRNILF